MGTLVAMAASLAALGSLAIAGPASAASPRTVYGSAGFGTGLYYWPSATNTPVNTIATGGPISMAITPDGTKGYIATNTGDVTPFNTSTNAAGTSFFVASSLHDVAISPDGLKAYIGNGNTNGIKVISTVSNTVIQTITGDAADDTPDRIALSPDGTKLYVVHRGVNPTLTIRDSTTGAQIGADISLGDFNTFPAAVAVTPNGHKLYIASTSTAGGSVSVIDLTASPSPTLHTVPGIGGNPAGIAVTPDGSEVYTANNSGNNVTVIRTSDDTIVGTPISTSADGRNPNGIAITPDGKHAYVSNSNAGAPGDPITFSYIDTTTKTVGTPVQIGTFPGPNPNGVAIVPDQGPTADFSDTPAQAGSPTGFDASGSTDPEDGTAASYLWNFGDSTSATTTSPTTTHTYATGGDYNVTLTVTDSEGCSNTFIYSGQTAYCNPNTVSPAQTGSMVTIPAAPTIPPSGGAGGPAPTPAATTPAAPTAPAAPTKKCKKAKKSHQASAAKKKCKKK